MNTAQCYILGLILFAVALLAIVCAVVGRRQNKPIAFTFFLGKSVQATRGTMRAHSALLFMISILSELISISLMIRAALT
jgi:hypothetical protein